MRTAVALGSNLGDPRANLVAAKQAINDLDGVAEIVASSIYETDPVDCEPGAQKFLNAVIEFEYDGDPVRLLQELRQIETDLGRPSMRPRNVSRSIDLDLLYVGDIQMETEQLQLPHPRLHLRRFVLEPLAEIRPDLIPPNQTKSVRTLLALLDESGKVLPIKDQWHP